MMSESPRRRLVLDPRCQSPQRRRLYWHLDRACSDGRGREPRIFVCWRIVFVSGLGMWIFQLLPGRGHWREPRVEPSLRPHEVIPVPGEVGRLPALPRIPLGLPVKVHPVSAGIKGGFVGGLVMPVPALLYGILPVMASGGP